MPSAAALLLVAVTRVPFGANVTVTARPPASALTRGTTVGDFLVAEPPRPLPGGRVVVTLRPLALGRLAVPLTGDPTPAEVDVTPALAPDAAAAGPLAPRSRLPLGWLAAAGTVALAAAVLLRRRRRSKGDPFAELRRSLAPLAVPQGWSRPGAADLAAAAIRRFLARSLSAPCQAMTTRELSDVVATGLGEARAQAVLAALELCDAARFASVRVAPDDGAGRVRGVLDAAAHREVAA